MAEVDFNEVSHIAIIMDGNRRWAQNRGERPELGHKAGAKALTNLIKFAASGNLKYLTVYMFSTENWSRPQNEVNYLMSMIMKEFEKFSKKDATDQNCKVRILGMKSNLSSELKHVIEEIEIQTCNNTGLNLNLAFNYGGRQEITGAIKAIAGRVSKGEISCDQIDTKLVEDMLYTHGMPDPDMVIRTGGEQRTSNFLPWQSVYSEYIFLDVFWPDFGKSDLIEALTMFRGRKRRFGGG